MPVVWRGMGDGKRPREGTPLPHSRVCIPGPPLPSAQQPGRLTQAHVQLDGCPRPHRSLAGTRRPRCAPTATLAPKPCEGPQLELQGLGHVPSVANHVGQRPDHHHHRHHRRARHLPEGVVKAVGCVGSFSQAMADASRTGAVQGHPGFQPCQQERGRSTSASGHLPGLASGVVMRSTPNRTLHRPAHWMKACPGDDLTSPRAACTTSRNSAAWYKSAWRRARPARWGWCLSSRPKGL